MTIIDFLGYWALVLVALVVLSALTIVLANTLFRAVFQDLTSTYEIYVLRWWLAEIKASGRSIPTKKNVASLLRDIDNSLPEDDQ